MIHAVVSKGFSVNKVQCSTFGSGDTFLLKGSHAVACLTVACLSVALAESPHLHIAGTLP